MKDYNCEEGRAVVIADWSLDESALDGYQVLYHQYECPDYEGSARTIVRRIEDGQLFETYGSHCSCYLLEGQWELEEISTEFLQEQLRRKVRGPYYLHNEDWESIDELVVYLLGVDDK